MTVAGMHVAPIRLQIFNNYSAWSCDSTLGVQVELGRPGRGRVTWPARAKMSKRRDVVVVSAAVLLSHHEFGMWLVPFEISMVYERNPDPEQLRRRRQWRLSMSCDHS